VPAKLLKQCSVLWACADYDPSRVTSRLSNHMPKHVGVENLDHINKNIHYFLEHLLVLLQTTIWTCLPDKCTGLRIGGGREH
jgi:hypothetical protein